MRLFGEIVHKAKIDDDVKVYVIRGECGFGNGIASTDKSSDINYPPERRLSGGGREK